MEVFVVMQHNGSQSKVPRVVRIFEYREDAALFLRLLQDPEDKGTTRYTVSGSHEIKSWSRACA